MPLEEFQLHSAQLIEEAKTWTNNTVPKTIDDFPFFPSSIINLFDTLLAAKSEMTLAGSELIWSTNLSEILPSTQTGMEYTHSFRYIIPNDPNMSRWDQIDFIPVVNSECQYHLFLPDDVRASNNLSLLGFYGNSCCDGWDEGLWVIYTIKDKQIIGDPSINLVMNHQYKGRIDWSYSDSTYSVRYYSDQGDWKVDYNAITGMITSFSK